MIFSFNYFNYFYLENILKLFFGIFFFSIVVILIPLLSNYLIQKIETKEKLSSYECGFEPFDTARSKFEIKFYLVAILFIIFDLEVAYLFPWCLIFNPFNFIVLFFLVVLTIGFVYEYTKGALDWS